MKGEFSRDKTEDLLASYEKLYEELRNLVSVEVFSKIAELISMESELSTREE